MKNLAVFFVLLSISSCGEPPPKPNEPFYCKVDGKRYRPDNGGDAFFQALLAKKSVQNNLFYITVYSENNGELGITAKFKDIKSEFKEKKYIINEEFKADFSTPYKTVNGIGSQKTYESFSNGGYVTFSKIDSLRQRVSGTFEFKAKDKNSDKIIIVSKGQFNDLFYY
jgi:hypothetical protein